MGYFFALNIDLLRGIFPFPLYQPCDPPVNDFDTSDLLCVPGRARKLNIFNCDLTRLLEEEDRNESLPENLKSTEAAAQPETASTSAVQLPKSEATIEQPELSCGPAQLKESADSERPPECRPYVVASRQVAVSGEEMMARRTRRMSLIRRSIQPKKIVMDDIPEEEQEISTEPDGEAGKTATAETVHFSIICWALILLMCSIL